MESSTLSPKGRLCELLTEVADNLINRIIIAADRAPEEFLNEDDITIIKDPPRDSSRVVSVEIVPMTYNIIVNGIGVFTPDTYPEEMY